MFKTTPQLAYGFIYDARKEEIIGLKQADEMGEKEFYPRPVKKLIHSKKDNVRVITQGFFKRNKGNETPAQAIQTDYLSYRDFKHIFKGKPVLPGELTAVVNNDIYFVIDFEEERCGYIYFDIDTSEGTIIDIAYGEHLDDLRVRASVGGRNFANRYISREGKQEFAYYFRRIAGRYMQVHISGFNHLIIYDFGIIRSDYPLNHYGKFVCSDSLHNKIHDICRDTLACCIHEHYEDSPWREQALYASDSRNQMLFGYYVFSEYNMARASLEMFARSMWSNGYLPICAPTDTELCIPSFCFIWFVAMKDYLLYSGDSTLAEELWEQIVYMLDKYTANMKENIARRPHGKAYWHFYEWSEGNYFDEPFAEPASAEFEDNYCDGLYNVFLALAIKSALCIGQRISKVSFCDKYSTVLETLIEGINSHFWNEEKQLYSSCTEYGRQKHYGELMQSIAILIEAVDGGRAKTLCEKLADKENSLVKITLSYTLYKYDALLMKSKSYLKTILSEISSVWGKMLFSGTSAFWEVEEGADGFDRAGSLCHGWSAVPIYIYYRYALGITPEFMRGETECTDSYKVFETCRGIVKTSKGVKEILSTKQ